MKKVTELSVFFPAYNEEKNIKKTVLNAVKVLKQVSSKWEIVVVNDGSTDKTGEIVKRLSKNDKRIKLIDHQFNKGYGGALKTGIASCQYNLIAYTDSDGQFDFWEINKFLKKMEKSDLAIGYRLKRTDILYRRVLAKILMFTNLILFGLNVKDVDCGFKLFKRKVIKEIGQLYTSSAITETELLVRAKKKGFKVCEIGVKHNSRIEGEQTGGKAGVVIKAAVDGLSLWWSLVNKKEFFYIFFIILTASFLRLYRLEDLMNYLGDEGRDMLIVMDILNGKNFPFIGPSTSIGELYLGPIYYYFIAPFAWVFKMNPVGPAVFVALLGILTVPLLFYLCKRMFNITTAFFASFLYTFSPIVVKFSRSSWNPNPMPFFVLSLILSLFYWQKTEKSKFLYLAIICFAIMLQLHYMVIILIPFLIFSVCYLNRGLKSKKPLLIGGLIFLLLLSPLILFDLKHGFINYKGFIEIYRTRAVSGFSLYGVLSHSRDRLRQLFSLFFGFTEREGKNNLMVIITLLISLFTFKKHKKLTRFLIYGFFFWALLSLGLYWKSVFEHYLTFLFPFPAIFLGYALSFLYKKGKFSKVISLILFFTILTFMFEKTWTYLSRPVAMNVKLVKKISKQVEAESQGQPFNFALLAHHNYDASYRYFFRLWQTPVVFETEVTEQLFVVCEDQDICQPEGNSKWEIALFDAAYNGQIEKIGQWQPDPLISVFKFIPKK
ncbi:hypothetical protein COT75_01900 [Candidatus Beckwithbacteria bacterium CG10_big_fil_rev_8_21_14_0_10_34_10]|uniref:Glycosyltransferase 2-like domain-containing protein n=1 Tax=Candidatus Beckwithbacteria bacterium CG10_big_fil_rev_8_21_14_0_10_34_10 TaxID=1974495 RepID=A0A2H0W9T3_9BACT|nr:MAG: hypothetical protein COT75_01900 [Candidatus Beckwithbacteria bacterium CG10_big_fil_rev_8_21_14_0_10_34_10]